MVAINTIITRPFCLVTYRVETVDWTSVLTEVTVERIGTFLTSTCCLVTCWSQTVSWTSVLTEVAIERFMTLITHTSDRTTGHTRPSAFSTVWPVMIF
jgi:hypothetical protein